MRMAGGDAGAALDQIYDPLRTCIMDTNTQHTPKHTCGRPPSFRQSPFPIPHSPFETEKSRLFATAVGAAVRPRGGATTRRQQLAKTHKLIR